MLTRTQRPVNLPRLRSEAVGQSLSLQRACACNGSSGPSGGCAECRNKGTALRTAASSSRRELAPPIIHDVLRSTGQPLESSVRKSMERRFGHDFSRVRINTDSRANESAGSVNALAYTVGRDMVFGRGQYVPGTLHGTKLIAHELAHVVQQGDLQWAGVPLAIGSQHDAGEREAQEAAEWPYGGRLRLSGSSGAQRLQMQSIAVSMNAGGNAPNRKCLTSGFGENTYRCYCGRGTAPGCGDFQCEPYDELDACCRQHDQAYGDCNLEDTLVPFSRCSLKGKAADLVLCACAAGAGDLKQGGDAYRMEVLAFFGVLIPILRVSPWLMCGPEWMLLAALDGLALPPRVIARGKKLLTQGKTGPKTDAAAARCAPGAQPA